MTPAELRIATRDGTVLRALHWGDGAGDGTPVLLIHGLASNCRLWDGAAKALVALGHDVVALDLRGHGDSDWDPSGDYSLDAFQFDMETWCDMLGRPAVVGASMGGVTAMWTEGVRGQTGLEPASRALDRKSHV